MSKHSEWWRYLVEILTLTCIAGILFGIIKGISGGFKYVSLGLFPLLLDTLKSSLNDSLVLVFLILFIYTIVFFLIHRLVKNTRWACFVSAAVALLPFFLLWGYEINKANYVYWSSLSEWRTISLNLKVALAFIAIWALVSAALFLWTKSMLLNVKAISIKPLGLLIGLILAFNVSIYFLHKFSGSKDNSPNVLILLVDCLRADHLSSYGYNRNTTPNIDKFSKDAVVFTQAISQSTFTKMSIASLFTSLYPYQHGVYRGAGELIDSKTGSVTTDTLGDEETTLAELLFQNGFLTVAWLQQGQLTSYTGFDQGFVDYNERQGNIDNINKKFIEWAKKIGRYYKFFTYIHYNDLHSPYRPKPPYDTLFAGQDNTAEISNAERQKVLYDGQLNYIDHEIGLLIGKLKEIGLYDDTLIIITGDHGDAFGEHGFLTHSRAPYEELIRVPLIIKFPDSLFAGEVVRNQVRLIDIMPTISDFLDIEPVEGLEGFSLMNYLHNNEDKGNGVEFPRYAISEIYNARHNIDALSIRTEQFKYIYFRDKEDELYDLKADPGEQKNIAGQKPHLVQEFRDMLPTLLTERDQKRSNKAATLDKKTVEELKALGYIQ